MRTTTVFITLYAILLLNYGDSGDIFKQCVKDSPFFVIFSSNRRDNKIEDLLNRAPKTMQKPRMIISNSSLGPILSYVNKDLVSFVIVPNKSIEDVLKVVRISLRRLHETRIVFLLGFDPSTEFIQMLANWCWAHRMINVLILIEGASNRTENQKLYSFNPFPTLRIEKLPGGSECKDVFPNKVTNLKGFPIRTVQKYDHPRSFMYTNYKGRKVIGGYLAKVFYSWVSIHNASVEIVDNTTVFIPDLVKRYLLQNKIDVAQHYLIPKDTENLTSTSSIYYGKLCTVVPQSSPIPPPLYLLLPFKPKVWYLIIYTIVYVTIADSICSFLVYGRLDLGRAFCNILRAIMYQGVERKNFRYRPFVAVRGQLFVLGFILTNLFLGLLSSFVTVVVYEPESNTFEDIERSGVRLLLQRSEFTYFVSLKLISAKWEHLFNFVDRETVTEQLRVLNNSYGYVISCDRYNMINFIETPLRRKIFHQMPMNFHGRWVGMTIRDDSVILNSFNKHITRTFDVGLNAKWMNDIGRESIEAGIVKPFHISQDPFSPITGEHLQLSLYCLIGGYFSAACCFLLELGYNRVVKISKFKKECL
ncbi:unnamed protein product [Hermetia illucens]|uniref:Ionotropic receptor n=1 Tax=Hermetia illucens TaxID=343691 RepID=A0A7R8UA88_HERIL|nr:unnamed protein product [Hermetia illucens]